MRTKPALALFFLSLLLASCLGGGDTDLPGMGEPCDVTRPCRDGFCYGTPGRQYCTAVCKGDDECGPDLVCEPEEEIGNRICQPGIRCVADTSCPLGHRCDRERQVCHLSVRRDLCGSCTTDAQCPPGGICVHARSTGERFCSAPCKGNDDCPSGYLCRSVERDGVRYDGTTLPRQCIPEAETCNAERPLCSPCAGDWECGGELDFCLENRLSGERRCGRSCKTTCVWNELLGGHFDNVTGEPCSSGCPPGFACLDVGGGHQCVPERASCDSYCDASTPLEERMQCGPGHACDRSSWSCVAATDGRTCSPCVAGSCPSAGSRPSLCVVNHDTGESYCAAGCSSDEECRADYGLGFSCREVEGRRVCLPDKGSCATGSAPLGAGCTSADDCAGSVCLLYGERGICSGSCSEDGDCGDARFMCCALAEEGAGYDCAEDPSEGGGICVPRGGRFGDDCEPGRPPCEDGYCLDIGSARVCTAGCGSDADCDRVSGRPGAFHCSRATLDSEHVERVNVCFPAGGGEIGSDCSFGSAACADGICLERTLGRICSRSCSQEDCPNGWKCDLAPTLDGGEFRVCLPP